MKYRYSFTLRQQSESSFSFAAGDHILRLDFLAPDLVRAALYREGERLLPTWSVCPGDGVMPPQGRPRLSTEGFSLYTPEWEQSGSIHTFHLGGYALSLNAEGPSLSVLRGGEALLSDRPFCAYDLEGEYGPGVRHFLASQPGEVILGLGEKTGNVDRAGRSFTLGARDPMGYDAEHTDPLYKHIPFYICENAVGSYGIFYDTHAQGRFDFGREIDNYFGPFKTFSCEDNALVYYLFLGDTPQVSRRFAWLCGRPAFPPKWSLDYCGSTMAYTEAPDADAQLRGFLEKCREHGLECSGFYLSSGYTTIDGKRYVFHWDRDKFPDPGDFCRTFEDSGVHLLPNIKPAFLTDHPLYPMMAERGWFLHYADGSPAVVPFWAGWGSYLDFTNPEAFDFWSRMVTEQLLDYGVTATWNDNNEFHIADPDILACGFGESIPASRICQVFPLLMVMASHRAQTAHAPHGRRQMLSTRSGGAGLTRLAQTWSGDNRTSFNDLRYNHKVAMGMSLSGIYVFGHDIGGFAGEKPGPELFLRWLQYGVLLPRFCIHSWNTDQTATEPWTYPELMDSVRAIFALRRRLKPMLYDLLYRAHAGFEPFLAPVFYYFPGYDRESDAFLLGRDVLAGCVFDEGQESLTVTLPENEGGWYLEGKHLQPGRCTLPCPARGLPLLFCRGGSVLAEDVSPCGSPAPEPVFTVYPIPEGEFTAGFFDDDGESFGYQTGDCVRLAFTVRCTAREVRVKVEQLGKRVLDPELRLTDVLGRKLVIEG